MFQRSRPGSWLPACVQARPGRRSRRLAFLPRFAFLVLAGCVALSSPTRAKPTAIASGNNAFAVDLYKQLASEDGNLFFSPLSIHIALSMTYAGAAGVTADEMAAVLHLPSATGGDADRPLDPATIADLSAPALRALMEPPTVPGRRGPSGEPESRPAYELTVANALWVQDGFPLKAPFLEAVRGGFGSTTESVDFENAEQAAARINDWVAKATKDRIQNLVPPESLRELVRLVLTSAIYFKSGWQSEFHEPMTKDAPFFMSAAESVSVPLMQQTHDFGYFGDDQVQVLELLYDSGELSMIVVLPREPDELESLEAALTAKKLEEWMGRLERKEVRVWLPRFELDGEFGLGPILAGLGMRTAFNQDHADFTGMTDRKPFFISEVRHKAFIAVDEEGTEAAAATAVLLTEKSLPVERHPEPEIFRADHPFLFVIRHRGTGAALFLGRVANPAA